MSVAGRKIRLLACDVDGTLIHGSVDISERVQRAVAEARDAGIHVLLATGRMPSAARRIVETLGLAGPQVYYNGALVQTVEGSKLFEVPVAPAVAQRVVRFAREAKMHLNAYVGDTIYVERMTPEAEFTRQLNRVEPQVVADLVGFLERAPTKLVIVRLPVVEEGLVPSVAARFDGELSVSRSVPQYCEMVNPSVDKGRALQMVADKLGLSMSEVAAIGDGDNDRTLLEAAGTSFAMGNGSPRIKSLATHVVGTVEDDGVAEAIERYVLADYDRTPDLRPTN